MICKKCGKTEFYLQLDLEQVIFNSKSGVIDADHLDFEETEEACNNNFNIEQVESCLVCDNCGTKHYE